jgi:hypothetical protein
VTISRDSLHRWNISDFLYGSNLNCETINTRHSRFNEICKHIHTFQSTQHLIKVPSVRLNECISSSSSNTSQIVYLQFAFTPEMVMALLKDGSLKAFNIFNNSHVEFLYDYPLYYYNESESSKNLKFDSVVYDYDDENTGVIRVPFQPVLFNVVHHPIPSESSSHKLFSVFQKFPQKIELANSIRFFFFFFF